MNLQTFKYEENIFSYMEYGNAVGFPILVQHGLIASIKDYDLFQSLIDSGRRIICIARPGYGESSPYKMHDISEWGRIVSSLLNELQINDFDVLGTSSGAPYCYSIAYASQTKIRNTFIFSGTPALYNHEIAIHWPYPIDKNANIPDLQQLAKTLFFSNLTDNDLKRNDVIDSLSHDCFGIALDLQIRCRDWGFDLSQIHTTVYMQHGKNDSQVPFISAQLTSKLLPRCYFEPRETGDHFSKELLEEYIRKTILQKSA
jgi:pimeloyl-ACP methyl ester carboxylesterase